MIRRCKDCSKSWRVDLAEQQWCRARGMSLPRQCAACRATRRGLTDRTIACARCGEDFTYSAALAVLVTTFAWTEPTRCVLGCDDKARKNLRGERKQLAELQERLLGPSKAIPSDIDGEAGRPSRPEDLFKGLDAMLEKAAAEAAADAGLVDPSLDDDVPAAEDGSGDFGIKARPGEDVPSPDDLFRGLEGPSRKSSHD